MMADLKGTKKNLPKTSIIGPGRLGQSLYLSVQSAGYPVAGVIGRSGKPESIPENLFFRQISDAPTLGEICFICTPDDAIAKVANQLDEVFETRIRQKRPVPATVAHVSGALDSSELKNLEKHDVCPASFHPMQTFTLPASASHFERVYISLESEHKSALQTLSGVAKSLGANAFEVSREQKLALHVGGVFVANFMSALFSMATKVLEPYPEFSQAFMQEYYGRLMQTTLENILANGVPEAFTGPAMRGDAETVRRHLIFLHTKKELQNVYSSLTHEIAFTSQHHDPAIRESMIKVLDEFEKGLPFNGSIRDSDQ